MDQLLTGTSSAARARTGELAKAIGGIMTGSSSISFDSLLDKLKAQSDVLVTREDIRSALDQMVNDEEVMVKGSGSNPTIKLLASA